MIAIIITCDDSGESIDLTEEYGVTSLKQGYFKLKNNEIPEREVYKCTIDGKFKHRKYNSNKEAFAALGS